ncbi:MAG: gluconate 2-dehydrogenase subunit 3 family protein, partial [Gemmatimonadales bacterium]
ERGHSNFFRCQYHNWVYNSRGELQGMSQRSGYPDDFDRSELSLVRPAHVASYRGLVFANLDPQAEPLEQRLAGVAGYIDARLAESLDAEWQARWRSGLATVDRSSRELHGRPLLEATPEQRVAVLTRLADAADEFFHELKSWTVRGYYTSKIGIHADQQYKGNVYQRGDYAGYDAT